jgi:alpha-D-xyloside xylohydrolase
MPYLFGQAVAAHREGMPMMRPLVADFPDDPAVTHLDRQYMLGDSLLVAPVFNASGETAYYVPAGVWTHLQTGREVAGPGWVRETVPFDQVPVLVRPGTVLPLGAEQGRPDYAYADGVTLALYRFADGAAVTVSVPGLDGEEAARFAVSRDDGAVTVVREAGDPLAWRVLVVGGPSTSVPAGTDRCRLRIPVQRP